MTASDWIALASAIALALAAWYAWRGHLLAQQTHREARADRERDRVHDQLDAIVACLREFNRIRTDHDAMEIEFEVARAQLAAALALNPVSLPAVELMLTDAVKPPPYGFGDEGLWDSLLAALEEVRAYAHRALPPIE